MWRRKNSTSCFPREFLKTITEASGKVYGSEMSMEMMKVTKEELFEEVTDNIGAMEFMEMSEGAQILFI